MVIGRMGEQVALPIEGIGGQILRAPDGLALSSRNNYLSPAERAEAVHLSRALADMANALRNGSVDIAALEQAAMADMNARGWQPDYMVARRRTDLQAPAAEDTVSLVQGHGLVLLGAARLGKTRLIDNLEV